MQFSRMLLLVILAYFLLFFGCSEKSPSQPENNSLIGTWVLGTMDISMIFLTNSNQTAVNIYTEGVGGINLTGTQNATLNYLIDSYSELYGIIVSNFCYYYLSTESYPTFNLMVNQYSGMLYVSVDESTSTTYMASSPIFSYDSLLHSLNISDLTLTNEGDTINASGTLSNVLISVPANSPTEMTIPSDLISSTMGEGSTTLTFASNGTFNRTSVLAGSTETAEGTWTNITPDSIKIIETYISDDISVCDTIYFHYQVTNSALSLSINIDMLTTMDDSTPDQARAAYEIIYGLSPGSLISLKGKETMIFSHSIAKIVSDKSVYSPWPHRNQFKEMFEKIINRAK